MKRRKQNNPLRRTLVLASAVTVLSSAVANTGTSWAWFTRNSSAKALSIQAASFGAELTGATYDETQGGYPVEAGTLTLTLTPTGTASKGYCHILSNGTVLNCVALQKDTPAELTLTLGTADTLLTLETSWGTCTMDHPETVEDLLFTTESAPSNSVTEIPEEVPPVVEEEPPVVEEEPPVVEEEPPVVEEEPPVVEEEPPVVEEEPPIVEEEPPVVEEEPPVVEEEPPVVEEEPPVVEEEPPVVEEEPPVVEEEPPAVEEPVLADVSDTSLIQVSTSSEISAEVTEAEETVREMPLYFQNDYPNQRYGSGTVATSGCGITSLAMVATHLSGHDYFPDELAQYFGGDAENNVKRLEYASEAMGLPWEYSENFDITMQGLRDGKIAIALMREGSLFTEGQHFIVLKGLTEDGRILVNDPNSGNYTHWDLEYGFADGFLPSDIVKGYDSAWLYDPAQMPENPERYYEDNGLIYDNYPGVELTWEEQELIAKVIWVEAQGECFEGQQAVAEIVLNRLVSGSFGETVSNVVYGEGQFRSAQFLKDATPWQQQYEALDAARYGTRVLPENVYYFATEKTNENVWGQIGGHIFCY